MAFCQGSGSTFPWITRCSICGAISVPGLFVSLGLEGYTRYTMGLTVDEEDVVSHCGLFQFRGLAIELSGIVNKRRNLELGTCEKRRVKWKADNGHGIDTTIRYLGLRRFGHFSSNKLSTHICSIIFAFNRIVKVLSTARIGQRASSIHPSCCRRAPISPQTLTKRVGAPKHASLASTLDT